MIKENYLKLLGQLLRDHYRTIKDTGIESQEQKQYIDGYLAASKALNAVYQKDLKDYIERIHFEVFGMTVEDREKLLHAEAPLSEEELDVPAYKRKGITLKF